MKYRRDRESIDEIGKDKCRHPAQENATDSIAEYIIRDIKGRKDLI